MNRRFVSLVCLECLMDTLWNDSRRREGTRTSQGRAVYPEGRQETSCSQLRLAFGEEVHREHNYGSVSRRTLTPGRSVHSGDFLRHLLGRYSSSWSLARAASLSFFLSIPRCLISYRILPYSPPLPDPTPNLLYSAPCGHLGRCSRIPA